MLNYYTNKIPLNLYVLEKLFKALIDKNEFSISISPHNIKSKN